ncbi:MAG TPA: ABC transporter substrate-binding protein [Cyclobacteriaceae bacterium]|nr:ABC transporter substrate-binding protein [Cyclobacteriaceae bacterium]HMV09213.1 ABC transporter substrate-binding protein [Cyclobacteriaceae bacterium]HMV90849.1 ABC transporter substrate-binding protein [Cyclobacteriaceae bacterium]HMX01418.1 ABC transporter substrate-binding protein [Cyclobacteriaceae bacterium]HMX50312.1 ABC transporter substrate-binding protein [Cyclobacteriaceae bacterium]
MHRTVRYAGVLMIAIGFVLSANHSFAQTDYKQQYTIAKKLYTEGKYNLAMESFKKLIPYDQNNPYREYASFYYALSAYNQNFKAVAKDMLGQIKSLYPSWDKMDEVNIWLAKIHFDNKDYFQGMKLLGEIKNDKTRKEVAYLKKQALIPVTDVETLKMMLEEYPKDEVIGEKLARELSKNQLQLEDQKLLESLISRFDLKKEDYFIEAPETIHKDVYTVSVMFPFVVTRIDATTSRKPNQFVLDLYEGMMMAVDTLAKQGVKINVRAYDTERRPDKIKSMLLMSEMKSTDLIVGPLYSEENTMVQEFSQVNQINLFNPISNNYELIRQNPYGFLFQPSNESIGSESAEYLAATKRNRKCMVFYGESKRDSTLAANFVAKARESGLKVLRAERVTKESSRKIIEILATPTEFDEFKYPTQFTLRKDSLGSVFVASDDPLIYSKVISCVETRKDSVTIVGSENWLDQSAVDYSKYESLGIKLYAPNFSADNNPAYRAFQRKFVKEHGRNSSSAAYTNYAKIGYDFMLFAGQMLKKHGVYFQDALQKSKQVPGYLSSGYDFTEGRTNQYVPFIEFQNGKLVEIQRAN